MKFTLMIMVLALNSATVWADSGLCMHALGGSRTTSENPVTKSDQPDMEDNVKYTTGLFEQAIHPSSCILDTLTVQETVVQSLALVRKGTDEDRLKIALALNNARNIGLIVKDRSKMPDEVLIGVKIQANLTPKEDTDLKMLLAKDQIAHQAPTSSSKLLARYMFSQPMAVLRYDFTKYDIKTLKMTPEMQKRLQEYWATK